jgi:hypothetical protein
MLLLKIYSEYWAQTLTTAYLILLFLAFIIVNNCPLFNLSAMIKDQARACLIAHTKSQPAA